MKDILLQDEPGASIPAKDKILYLLCLIFFFAIYVPGVSWLYNVCMWLLFAYSLFINTAAEKWAVLKMRPSMVVIILFFLFNCCSALFSHNIKEGVSWVGIRISLLVFPLAFGTITISSQLKDRIILAFVTATGCAAAFCLLHAAVRVWNTQDWSLMYNDNLSDIVNLQSIYFAMLINIALLGVAYLYFKGSALVNRHIWWVLFIFLPVHFLLASRIAIIFLYGLIFVFSLYMILFRKKWLQGIAIAGGMLLVALTLLFFFPKTINRFKEIAYTQFNYSSTAKESHYNMALTPDQWNGANIRIAVWECAWTLLHRHPLLGTGLGDKMDDPEKTICKKRLCVWHSEPTAMCTTPTWTCG